MRDSVTFSVFADLHWREGDWSSCEARLDRSVVAAMDLIRARAVTNVSPREVVALFGCSRRMAEMRFRAATGHSILDEIHDVQIEHAKNLLANPRVKASMVPSLCGYESNPFFMRLFRRATGMSMGEWRERRIRGSVMPAPTGPA